MIYLPKRAVFIHIPRTGGNSIKNAIASSCVGHGIACLISTTPNFIKEFEMIQGHQTAYNLKPYIKEWDDIYRFAVHRPQKDRFESMFRLIENVRDKGSCTHPNIHEEIKEVVCRDDYREWILENWNDHTTEFFTKGKHGEDLGVELYNFDELNIKCDMICDKCQIPRCTLPKLCESF